MAARASAVSLCDMTRVLVAYASKRGSTSEIAQAVADELGRAGLEADCRDAGQVDDLDGVDAVVLGSAVYMRRWRGDARRFLRRHRRRLAELPLWVFSSGPTGDPARDDARWTEPRHTIKKIERLGAREHVVFGGRMPLDPGNAMERAMIEGTPTEWRDRRDWDAIRAWAAGVASALQTGSRAA